MKRLLLVALAVMGILATACITQFSTLFVDDDGRTHFVGLASNLTDVDVVAAVIEVNYFDGSNIIGTDFVATCTRTLQAGQSSPFESIVPAGVDVDRAETIVHPLTFGERPTPDFDFEDIEFSSDAEGTHVTGTIENNNDDITYRAVQVCAAFFDEDEDVVRVGRAFTDPSTLSGGSEGDFDIVIPDLPSDAETYQLWADGTKRSPIEVTAPVVRKSADVPTATKTPTPTPTATPTATPTP